MRIGEALAGAGIDAREARLLLAEAARMTVAQVIAYPERELGEDAGARYDAWRVRRAAGEPIAYVLGRREFYGIELAVSPAVLIPRPETELLVDWALARIPADVAATVLDLGTGSGAIALAIKRHRPRCRVVAIDVSDAALAVARANAGRLGLDVDWRRGEWYAALGHGERFDLIVSNPPYVADADGHLGAGDLRFEPRPALAAGPTGLEALGVLVESAPTYIGAGGEMCLEHGAVQGGAVRDMLTAAGFEDVATQCDLAGLGRISHGRVRRLGTRDAACAEPVPRGATPATGPATRATTRRG